MLEVFATNVIISKGYDGAPALKFSDNGDSVRFRFGKKVYDTRAENNTRWVNMSVKAFDKVCERIKSMKLKEGSFVNLTGTLDEDKWTDQKTGEPRSQMVIILDKIEYASGGGGKKENQASGQTQNGGAYAPASTAPAAAAPAPAASGNFTGYEPFGGGSLFDEN